MVEEQEIVLAAKTRSNEILTNAESRTRELYRVANEYVDDALRRTEEAVNAALSEVKQSRANFRAAAGSAAQRKASASTIETVSAEDLTK
jgi:vacuolar-type H+-ATPase subunit H